MRKTIEKALLLAISMLLLNMFLSKNVYASEASLSVSPSSVNKGDNFTVTVNIPQDVSAYDIGGVIVTYADGSKQSASRKVGVNMDLSWPGNYSVSFPAKVVGNATISVNNVILSNSSNVVVNSNTTLEDTVTIIDNQPAPTETNSEAASTPAPAVPVAPVTLNFKDTNEKMYTSRRVNARQNYGTDSNIIQTLAIGTEVIRTGISDGNKDGYSWSRISYNGITGYVITGALTYDAPVQEEAEEKKEDEIKEEDSEKIEETAEDSQEVQELSDSDEALLSTLSEKYGTIPEVGLNIMPFLFFGSCISCIFLNIIVKKNSAL